MNILHGSERLLFQPAPQLTGTLTLNASSWTLPSVLWLSWDFATCFSFVLWLYSWLQMSLFHTRFSLDRMCVQNDSNCSTQRLTLEDTVPVAPSLLGSFQRSAWGGHFAHCAAPTQDAAQCPAVLRTAPASYCFSNSRWIKSSVKKIKRRLSRSLKCFSGC